MRREDIVLRDAARRGEPQACLTMATKLFGGSGGLARNHRLGLAYLQQELDRKSPLALLLAAREVPVDVLIAQQLQTVLRYAADRGCATAMLKLGTWLALTRAGRREGVQWLRRSGRFILALADDAADEARTLAQIVNALSPADGDAGAVTLAAAQLALEAQDLGQACLCLSVAAAIAVPVDRLAAHVSACVHLAAGASGDLVLPVELVQACMLHQSELGEAQVQYALGCAFAGVPYGSLLPHRLVRGINLELAGALLMRAADAGWCQAWLILSRVIPGFKSAVTHPGMARYFLEKAARSGIAQAQARYGAILMREAVDLKVAQSGVHWLHLASQQGDAHAQALLRTLVLPLPSLPVAYEAAVVARVRSLDRETGERLALARALHLTRHEALHFNARRDLRSWGIAVPGHAKENPRGRVVPVITDAMKAALLHAAAYFEHAAPIGGSLVLQRSRTQQHVFRHLGLDEAGLFAPAIGRSWSHPGYGRHWAAAVAPVLAQTLDAPGNKSASPAPQTLTAD